ncbi:MAG: 50S ribosomal protein L11 methyltransferase [Polyangiaceae bacterium]
MTERATGGAAINRDTVLIRAPELTVHVHSNAAVEISCDGANFYGGVHALSVLDSFTEPRKLGDVVEEIGARSARDFMTLTTTILEMCANGLLTPPDRGAVFPDFAGGWDGSSIHAKMLGDEQRTRAFLDALAEVVQPSDVVVDIGTGTGVLALGAARAGAKRVFAIESSSIADVAAAMFERNAALGPVELVRGWSNRVSIPERASVLVSETVGNQALGEEIIESVLDANKRLLTPDARRIPSHIRIFAQPCEVPSALRNRHAFTPENVESWSSRYGIDFGPLRDVTRSGRKAPPADKPFFMVLELSEARGWKKLGPPTLLSEVDLAAPVPRFERSADMRFDVTGELQGVLEFFELTLSPSVTFDGHPDRVSLACSWSFPAWLLAKGRPVEAGTSMRVGYEYGNGKGKLTLPPA